MELWFKNNNKQYRILINWMQYSIVLSLQFYNIFMDSQGLFLFTMYLINLTVSICILGIYIRRAYQLSKLASNKVEKMSFSIMLKVILIAIFILTDLAELVFSRLSSSFWLYKNQELENSEIVPILNMFIQIFIITREHKKKSVPSRWHVVYWTFLFLINSTFLCYLLIQNQINSYLTLPAVKIATLSVLFIYSVFMEQEVFEQCVQIPRQMNLLQKQVNNSTFTRPDTHLELSSTLDKIYIEFNKQINMHVVKEYVKYQFKIAVYVGFKSHIITKYEEDFKKLHSQLKKQSCEFEQLNSLSQTENHHTVNMLSEGEKKRKLYQEYLINLTKNTANYYQPLLNFLEIEGNSKIIFLQMCKRRRLTVVSEYSFDEHSNIQSSKFFKVKYLNNKISISNPDILQLNLQRNIKQIQEIHDRMYQTGAIKSKMIIQRSQLQVLLFVDAVVNNKKCWMDFSHWLNLGKKLQLSIYNMFDYWYYGFTNVKINVLGHQLAVDHEGQTYTLYLFDIIRKKTSKEQKTILKKRFSDFTKLDKQIRRYYSEKKHIKIPNLPPKVSPFGSKTSPKSRQIYLQTYLIELTEIQGMNHCIKFLQFLQVENCIPDANQATIYRSNEPKIQKSVKISMDQIKLFDDSSLKIQSLAINTVI